MDKFLGKPSAKDLETEAEQSQIPKKFRVGKSKVWRHFQQSKDGKTAKCYRCGNVYKTSGNTSNLSDHLKRLHPGIDVDNTPQKAYSVVPFISNTYDPSSDKKRQLDKSLSDLLSGALLPFSLVEDPSFRKFVKNLDPRYVVPSRKTTQNIYMRGQYDEMRGKLVNILNDIDSCAITTDCWTSKSNTAYMTVTCHFIDPHFDLRSAVLTTRPLVDETNHSAQNLASTLKEVLDEWKIFDKTSAITTDNASAMIKMCELLKKKHVPCFAHTINLVVQDCLSLAVLSDIMRKCKRIVTYFKSSTIATSKMKAAQTTEMKYSLIQEVATRWNSAYQMMERIVLTYDATTNVLLATSQAPAPLNADQLALIKDIILLLQPFDSVTRQISSNEVTISLIIPMIFGLFWNLEKVKNNIKSTEAIEVYNFLIEDIKKRLLPYEERSYPRIGTLLDPRFKKRCFLKPINVAQSLKLLEIELSALKISDTLPSGPPTPIQTPPASACSEENSFFDFLNDKKNSKTSHEDALLELRQYMMTSHASKDTSPLVFWKCASNDSQLKLLSRKFLNIPATSVESERMFSKAGIIVSDRRASLKPKTVDLLLFLNKNKWISDN